LLVSTRHKRRGIQPEAIENIRWKYCILGEDSKSYSTEEELTSDENIGWQMADTAERPEIWRPTTPMLYRWGVPPICFGSKEL